MKTNIDYHKLVVQNIPESYQKWFEEEKKYLQEKIISNSKVLEVGCGDGRSIFDILPITQNITGIDHDSKAVEEARENFQDYPSIKIIKADATDMPFENGEFEYIVCMTSFANFAEKKIIILEEMKRVLKDSGKIIISVFSEDALEERMKVYEKIGIEIQEVLDGKIVFNESVGDNVSEQFKKEELETIFSQANLHIEEIKKANIAYLCTVTK